MARIRSPPGAGSPPTPGSAAVAGLRKTLLLPLDYLLMVTREFMSLSTTYTPTFPDPFWTAVCAAMGSPTFKILLPQEEGAQTFPTRPSRTTPPALCTSMLPGPGQTHQPVSRH